MRIKLYVLGVLTLLVSILSISCRKENNKSDIYTPTPYKLQVPPGFPPPILNPNNPLTVEGVELGRHLFYEKKLSRDNSMSCASCHKQEFAFSDAPNKLSKGVDGLAGTFNAMHIVNMAWLENFFWNGRSPSLEDQAFHPIVDPLEMNTTWEAVLKKLREDPKYPPMFKKAFGTEEITVERVTKAIAQFERTLISGNSKYDKWRRGETTLTELELFGFTMFETERGDCFHCHGSTTTGNMFGAFGQLIFTNNGVEPEATMPLGRMAVTGNPADRGKFKIPSLRNVAVTFPYFHDGRFQSLQEVIEFYNMGGHPSSTIDPNMKAAGVGRNWTQYEKSALLAFLNTLTDVDFLTDPRFSDPNE